MSSSPTLIRGGTSPASARQHISSTKTYGKRKNGSTTSTAKDQPTPLATKRSILSEDTTDADTSSEDEFETVVKKRLLNTSTSSVTSKGKQKALDIDKDVSAKLVESAATPRSSKGMIQPSTRTGVSIVKPSSTPSSRAATTRRSSSPNMSRARTSSPAQTVSTPRKDASLSTSTIKHSLASSTSALASSTISTTASTSKSSLRELEDAQLLAAMIDRPTSPPRKKRPRTNDGVRMTNALTASSSKSSKPHSSSSRSPSPTTPKRTKRASASPTPVDRPTTPVQSYSSSATLNGSVLRSPAKDLSGIFDNFGVGSDASDDVAERSSSKSPRKEMIKSASTSSVIGGPSGSLVAGMAPRNHRNEPSREGSPTPTSQTVSPRPLGPSHSQPSISPTRARPGSPLGYASSSILPINVPALIESGSIAPRGAGSGVRKTYGSGARSFRRDRDEEALLFAPGANSRDEIDSQDAQTTTEFEDSQGSGILSLSPQLPRRSYAAMRSEYGVDHEEDLLAESEEASALKSITQLRAKGESARFVDELNYLVEGLTGSSMAIGVKRASAIEVIKRASEKGFLRRLKASGLVEQVYKDFRKAGAGEGGDTVLEICFAFFLVLVARDQRSAEPLLRLTRGDVSAQDRRGYSEGDVDLLGVIKVWLDVTWRDDSIGGESNGTVKGRTTAENRSLSIVHGIISEDWSSHSLSIPISLQSLSILLLSSVASFEPRAIFRPQQLTCSSGTLAALLICFTASAESLQGRIARYDKGLDLLPSTDVSSSSHYDLHLIALQVGSIETCLSVCPDLALAPLSAVSEKLVQALSTVILVSHLVIFGQTQAHEMDAMNCLSGALKLLVQLTISDPRWSAEFVASEAIVRSLIRVIHGAQTAAQEEERTNGKPKAIDEGFSDDEADDEDDATKSRFDVLCLALGALTTFVESVDGAKKSLRNIQIAPDCPESRKCTTYCRCAGATSSLNALVRLYLEAPPSSNELNNSFLTGYSGLLLGLTMLDSPANEAIVEAALELHPQARADLHQAMAEFASLHDNIEGQTEVPEEEGGQVAGKIREMLGRLKSK